MGPAVSVARRLVPVLLGLTLLAGCIRSAPPGWVPPVDDLIARHQTARAENGLGAFGVDPGMNANAQFHANRLLQASGGGCGNLFHSSELSAWYPGFSAENIICGTGGCPTDGAGVVNAWMASPQHRANILNPGYTWIGAGVSCDGQVFFAVAHYRSP